MNRNNNIKITAVLAIMLVSAASLFAGGPPPPPPPPLGIPVDAGALFLLIAGAAFGASKLVGGKKEETK
jgi:hypothetical protein